MAVADLIAKVRSRGRAAAKTAKELAVSIVEGANVTDEQITEAVRDAGLAYEQFADLVAKAEARKAAFEAFHARDYDAEQTQAVADYKQCVSDREAVKAEIEALHAESRRLGELEQGLVGKRHRIEAEKKAAIETFKAALGSTPSDWRLL
jgi:hypothetical protein